MTVFRVTVRATAYSWCMGETVDRGAAEAAVDWGERRALETGARCLIELTATQGEGEPEMLRRVTTGWGKE